MDQPRLCIQSQTPPVRFLRDAPGDGAFLHTFREGADYVPSPGGVTRMLRALLEDLERRRLIRSASWIALANHGPQRVRLTPRVAFERVRLEAGQRGAYAMAKGAVWDALHGIPPSPDAKPLSTPEVDAGLGLLSDAMAQRIGALHARERFDLVYTHDFQLLPLAKHLPPNVPRAFRWHIPVPERVPDELRRLIVAHLDRYDAVVVSTEEYARRMRSWGVRAPLHPAYPYVDEDARRRVVTRDDVATFEARWGLAPDDEVFLLVARLDPMKSQDVAIRALARVREALPRAKLVLVGDGGFSGGAQGLGMSFASRWRDRLVRLARDLKVEDRVVMTGALSEADLDVAYTRARAVVLPSRIEGFGLAVIEGWLYGRPVLVSRGAGVSELVEDGVNGYAFDAGDDRALAEQMLLVGKDAADADRMGREGRLTARACHLRAGRERVWRLLSNVLAQGSRTGAKRRSG